MSREIKFRVWFRPTWKYKCDFEDRYHRKLEDLSCSYYTQEAFFDDTWIDTDCYDSIEIEQYTGLKDKNGKEIYEGDLIKGDRDDDLPMVVYFGEMEDSDVSYFYLGWACGEGYSLLDYDKTCEIVGNIHQNPELLEDAEWQMNKI